MCTAPLFPPFLSLIAASERESKSCVCRVPIGDANVRKRERIKEKQREKKTRKRSEESRKRRGQGERSGEWGESSHGAHTVLCYLRLVAVSSMVIQSCGWGATSSSLRVSRWPIAQSRGTSLNSYFLVPRRALLVKGKYKITPLARLAARASSTCERTRKDASYWREDDALLSSMSFSFSLLFLLRLLSFPPFPLFFTTGRARHVHCPRKKRNGSTLHATSVYARLAAHHEITDSFYEGETRHRDSQSPRTPTKQPHASRGRNILNEHMIPAGPSATARRAGGATEAALRSRSAIRWTFKTVAENYRSFRGNFRGNQREYEWTSACTIRVPVISRFSRG